MSPLRLGGTIGKNLSKGIIDSLISAFDKWILFLAKVPISVLSWGTSLGKWLIRGVEDGLQKLRGMWSKWIDSFKIPSWVKTLISITNFKAPKWVDTLFGWIKNLIDIATSIIKKLNDSFNMFHKFSVLLNLMTGKKGPEYVGLGEEGKLAEPIKRLQTFTEPVASRIPKPFRLAASVGQAIGSFIPKFGKNMEDMAETIGTTPIITRPEVRVEPKITDTKAAPVNVSVTGPESERQTRVGQMTLDEIKKINQNFNNLFPHLKRGREPSGDFSS